MSEPKSNKCYVCDAVPCVETEEEYIAETGETVTVMRYDDVALSTLDGSGQRVFCCDCLTALRILIRTGRGL